MTDTYSFFLSSFRELFHKKSRRYYDFCGMGTLKKWGQVSKETRISQYCKQKMYKLSLYFSGKNDFAHFVYYGILLWTISLDYLSENLSLKRLVAYNCLLYEFCLKDSFGIDGLDICSFAYDPGVTIILLQFWNNFLWQVFPWCNIFNKKLLIKVLIL